MLTRLVLCLLALNALQSSVASAADDKNELMKEIKDRCERQMAQYGRSLVLACVEQDVAALQKIADYTKSHPSIATRCLSQMRQYGLSLVLACIEQDVDADRKLDQY